jgi:hypothetical protein
MVFVVLHRFGGYDASQTGVPGTDEARHLTTFIVASCARMRMTDIVRIGRHTRGTDITILRATSHIGNETTTTVSSRRASFTTLRPKAAAGFCIGYSRCLPPKRCAISKWRKSPKASAKKVPGHDLRRLLLGRIGWSGPTDVRVTRPAGKNGATQSPGTRSCPRGRSISQPVFYSRVCLTVPAHRECPGFGHRVGSAAA